MKGGEDDTHGIEIKSITNCYGHTFSLRPTTILAKNIWDALMRALYNEIYESKSDTLRYEFEEIAMRDKGIAE